jgi:hypothetical protein
MLNSVARHPPALLVTPVFIPTTSNLYNNLLVLVQQIYLQLTFPSLKNLYVAL